MLEALSGKRCLREARGPGMPGPYRQSKLRRKKNFKRPRPCHNSDTTGWYDGENGTGKTNY